ncbi:MAG: hypothetical protein IJK36_02600 [Bacteroidales bacterium]|nr:hypothetical protein [Bacteroidales bacterium]MBR0539098.1 hypothetical protein [Bacteroidales bacterium]
MKKTLLLLFVLILFCVSSCSVLNRVSLSNASIGDKCYLNATIFQAVNSHEALATTSHELNSIVVKLITSEDTYYDGKKVSGTFIMVDTYTYENKQNTIKTVPVFIKASEYKTPIPLQEQDKKPEGQKL